MMPDKTIGAIPIILSGIFCDVSPYLYAVFPFLGYCRCRDWSCLFDYLELF